MMSRVNYGQSCKRRSYSYSHRVSGCGVYWIAGGITIRAPASARRLPDFNTLPECIKFVTVWNGAIMSPRYPHAKKTRVEACLHPSKGKREWLRPGGGV